MRQWTVDAFAAAPFRGNPACVVEPFDRWPEERWMQSLAQENNQAETAFLLRTKEPGRFGLRWFTPTVEVPLCGHATLASAHTLISEIGLDADSVAFDTLSGQLSVAHRGGIYEMDFPKDEPRRIEPPPRLAEALGVQPIECWTGKSLIAVLENEAAVRGVTPDLGAIHRIRADDPSGRGNLVVTALADSGRDYAVVSRYFAPGSGIAEDPATGSIHCTLAPLFAKKLRRDEIRFHQAFPGRGGDLSVRIAGERVLISGQARTIIESRLRLTPPAA